MSSFRAIYWRIGSLSGATLLKKTNPRPFSGHCLPVVPYLGVGLTHPCWYFVWLDLVQVFCMLSQPLWIHLFLFPVMSGKQCFAVVLFYLWLFKSLYSFYDDLWALGGSVSDIDVPFMAQHTTVSEWTLGISFFKTKKNI